MYSHKYSWNKVRFAFGRIPVDYVNKARRKKNGIRKTMKEAFDSTQDSDDVGKDSDQRVYEVKFVPSFLLLENLSICQHEITINA